MARILVLYYSMYGHVETMARAVAEGARGAGAEVTIKRVAELVPREVAEKAHAKLEPGGGGPWPARRSWRRRRHHPRLPHALRRDGGADGAFCDPTGGLWAQGALIGKVGSAFEDHGQPAWRAGDDADGTCRPASSTKGW